MQGSAVAKDHAFRIHFGLTDTEPNPRDGFVRASGGLVVALRSWRPRAADEIAAPLWKLSTAPGHEVSVPQLGTAPHSLFPDYLNLPGLILKVESSSDARVDVETAGGNLSFRLSEQPPGVRCANVLGAVIVERAGN